MNITPAARLLDQAKRIRSVYAGPVQQLANERSSLGRVSHDTREQASTLESRADALKMAQASTSMLAKMWSEGKLDQLQQVASEAAAQASANPFAAISLSIRQGLSNGLSGKRDEELDAMEGAIHLSGAMGKEPAQYATNLNQALTDNYYGIPGGWLQGEVTPQTLSNASQSMSKQAETDLAQAGQLYDQAAQQWKSVEDVQKKLDLAFASRRDPALFAQKKELAKAFFAELDAEAQQNPSIGKELQGLAKEAGQGWLQPGGMLTSYRAQLARNNGEANKVDWKKMVGQFESTSFGR